MREKSQVTKNECHNKNSIKAGAHETKSSLSHVPCQAPEASVFACVKIIDPIVQRLVENVRCFRGKKMWLRWMKRDLSDGFLGFEHCQRKVMATSTFSFENIVAPSLLNSWCANASIFAITPSVPLPIASHLVSRRAGNRNASRQTWKSCNANLRHRISWIVHEA